MVALLVLFKTQNTRLQATTRELVDKVARSEMPDVWTALSSPVKEEILQDLLQGSERFIELMIMDLQQNITSILDVRGLMAGIVAKDKQVCTVARSIALLQLLLTMLNLECELLPKGRDT
jgi:hypothetical protein